MGSSSDSSTPFTPAAQPPPPPPPSALSGGPQGQFAARGGGLMYVPGQGLQYVPATAGQGSSNAYQNTFLDPNSPMGQLGQLGAWPIPNTMTPANVPSGAGGQGMMQGPTSFANASATPNASAFANANSFMGQPQQSNGLQPPVQANPSNQTPGGLILGPNHQLMRVPQPQFDAAAAAATQQQAAAQLAQQDFMNNQNTGSNGSM